MRLLSAAESGMPKKHMTADDETSDLDASYFTTVAAYSGIEVLRTPLMAPRANVIGERLLGSLCRENLDDLNILSGAHLRHVLKEYVAIFNQARPHQGIQQHRPDRRVQLSDRGRNGQLHRLSRTWWAPS
jgi:hypothetical protein